MMVEQYSRCLCVWSWTSLSYLLISVASRVSESWKCGWAYSAILKNSLMIFFIVLYKCAGCLQLHEILEISLNLYGPPGNCCVKCRWSTALVSSHDITGYRIAYLRNWSPFFIFNTVPYHGFAIYLGKLVDSVHCIADQSNANMSWIFLEIPPLEICSVKLVDTLMCVCVLW